MVTWRIYYDNGSTFDSEDGAWEDAPLDGVICIVRKDGDRVEFHSGHDHYLRADDDGTIMPTHDLGPWLRSLRVVKFGRYTSHRIHEATMCRARDDWKGK